MKHKADHIDFQRTISDLKGQSAEDRLISTVGSAVIQYARDKEQEAAVFEKAYLYEKKKNDFLIKIMKQNKIRIPDFSDGIPFDLPEPNEKHKPCFYDLLQGDKENNLDLLHDRIDGHGGKDVACILLKAKDDCIISRLPKKSEFNSEFTTTGTWRAISTYLNPYKKPDYSSVTLG